MRESYVHGESARDAVVSGFRRHPAPAPAPPKGEDTIEARV
ncbi:hypothetical protein [Streptomyces sp. NPDC054834]